MRSFATDSLVPGPFASFDIDFSKEDKLYRTLLSHSLADMIESYNYFLQNNVANILKGTYVTSKNNIVVVKDVEITYPQFHADGGVYWSTPFIARQTGSSYMADVRIIYTSTVNQVSEGQNFDKKRTNISNEIKTRKIGSIHILVGSCRCITQFKPLEYESLDDFKVTLSECPSSVGCYTINLGAEKTVTMDQKLKTNIFITFMTNDDVPRFETRITNMYNSMTALVRMQIGKNLPNVKVILPFLKGSHIPLYLIFYLLYYEYSSKVNRATEFSTARFGPLVAYYAPADERDRVIAFLTSSRKKFESFFVVNNNNVTTVSDVEIRKYIHSKMKNPYSVNAEIESEKYSIPYIAQTVSKELFVQCKTIMEKLSELCYMTCQTIRCAIGTRSLDSRDDLANQKVDSFIRMSAVYFTDQCLKAIQNESEDKGFKYGKNDRKEVIVEARKCITLNESIGEMCKITNRVNVRTNSVTLRQVSEDQLGFICPVKTPESNLTGLVKQRSAATHISDNREYEINHYLPVEDLFKPTIEYISTKLTPEFKYVLCIVDNNNIRYPLVHEKEGSIPVPDAIFVSSRILNLFNTLFEEKKAMYYIDNDAVIYIKFTPEYKLVKYQFEPFIGGRMFAHVPTEFVQAFSTIIYSEPNPDYKSFSSINPLPGCEMELWFMYQGKPDEKFPVSIKHSNGHTTLLNVSDYFVNLMKTSKILGPYDKISAVSAPDTVSPDGKTIPGKKVWIVSTKDPIRDYSYTHWSGNKCEYFIPAHMNRSFKVLINVMNEYISYEKSKTYGACLSFNGTIVVDPYTRDFYPKNIWVDGKKCEDYFRRKRRQGLLPYDSFAHYDEKDKHIGYYDDPGRLMTPLLIVDNNGDLIIDKINGWDRFTGYDYEKAKPLITSLYKEGCIEMLDAKGMDSTLLAVDIDECRGFNKLRKFLNKLDLKNVNSSLFQIKGSTYIKNEDFTSVIINGNHHDVEWTTLHEFDNVQTFTQDNTTYYGNYVIKKKIAKKLYTPVQKLVKPDNPLIIDTYYWLYRDTKSREHFKKGDFKFLTTDIDPEFDGTNIYLFDKETQRIVSYEVFHIYLVGDECFVDKDCTIVKVETFTRPSLDKNVYQVFDGKIIDDSTLIDKYFYPQKSIKDGKEVVKYIVPIEYVFSSNELTSVFNIKETKIHLPLYNTFTDLIKFNPETQTVPDDEIYDIREAMLYNATIRRYIDTLNKIPESILKPEQIGLDEQFHILNILKKDINELGVKRQIGIIRKFLNTDFKFTHCMVDPNQAYSFVANFVPRGGNNPGPRWTYQSSMGVQALGVGNVVHYRRFDTSVKRLIAPTEHAFETVAELPCNQVAMPVTQNFVFLVAANYKGFEDPIILSKTALEKFGRYEKEVCVKIVETKNSSYTELVSYPCHPNGDPRTGHLFRHLNKDGLPKLGSLIKVGDCLVGRTKIYSTSGGSNEIKRSNTSSYAGVGTEGIVTSIQIVGSESNNGGFRTIIIKLSERRKQQAGDKMAARFSQKGTIGDIIGGMINDGDPRLKIVDDCLMPYVTAGPNRGLRAEIVFNPASFPSRMTCGLIDEVLCTKASLYAQIKVDASSFHKLDHDKYRELLWSNKIFEGNRDVNGGKLHLDINASEILSHSDGEVIMDPSTGKPRLFYIGVVAYQILKHQVKDKETARYTGAYKPITHQPEEGRHIRGGQRMGEMERDAIISSGASGILFDRFMKCSDGYVSVYCYRCKHDSAISDLKTKTCAICGTVGSLTAVDETRIYKVLRHQLAAIGLDILQTLRPVDDFDAEKLRGNRMEAVKGSRSITAS